MANNPDIPSPDRIEPAAPPETPSQPSPMEEPMTEPGEIDPPSPDTADPGGSPLETPLPPD
jgi:hypothetical protein